MPIGHRNYAADLKICRGEGPFRDVITGEWWVEDVPTSTILIFI